MPYATVTDMQDRYPARDLIAISDPNNQAIQVSFIQQALADASAEIDSYIESRVKLPLSDPPARLNEDCCTIAMYKMQSLRPIHDIESARDRYKDVVVYLTRVSDGKSTLGVAADSAEPPQQPNSVITTSDDPVGGPPRRIFDRHKLKRL